MVEPTHKPAAVLLLFLLHSCLADNGTLTVWFFFLPLAKVTVILQAGLDPVIISNQVSL